MGILLVSGAIIIQIWYFQMMSKVITTLRWCKVLKVANSLDKRHSVHHKKALSFWMIINGRIRLRFRGGIMTRLNTQILDKMLLKVRLKSFLKTRRGNRAKKNLNQLIRIIILNPHLLNKNSKITILKKHL